MDLFEQYKESNLGGSGPNEIAQMLNTELGGGAGTTQQPENVNPEVIEPSDGEAEEIKDTPGGDFEADPTEREAPIDFRPPDDIESLLKEKRMQEIKDQALIGLEPADEMLGGMNDDRDDDGVYEDDEVFQKRLLAEPNPSPKRDVFVEPQRLYLPTEEDMEIKMNTENYEPEREVLPEEVKKDKEENEYIMPSEIVKEKRQENRVREILPNLSEEQIERVEATNNFNAALKAVQDEDLEEIKNEEPLTIDDKRALAIGAGMPDHTLVSQVNFTDKGSGPLFDDPNFIRNKFQAYLDFNQTDLAKQFSERLRGGYNLRNRRKRVDMAEDKDEEQDESLFNRKLKKYKKNMKK